MKGVVIGIDDGFLIFWVPERLRALRGCGECPNDVGAIGNEILLFRILCTTIFELGD